LTQTAQFWNEQRWNQRKFERSWHSDGNREVPRTLRRALFVGYGTFAWRLRGAQHIWSLRSSRDAVMRSADADSEEVPRENERGYYGGDARILIGQPQNHGGGRLLCGGCVLAGESRMLEDGTVSRNYRRVHERGGIPRRSESFFAQGGAPIWDYATHASSMDGKR